MEKYLSTKEALGESKDDSVFGILMQPGAVKDFQPLSKPELMAEGRSLFAAGVNTVGFTLSSTLFYIARDRDVQLRLQAELDASTPEQTLTSLQYMVGTLDDSVRVAYQMRLTLYPQGCLYQGRISPFGNREMSPA